MVFLLTGAFGGEGGLDGENIRDPKEEVRRSMSWESRTCSAAIRLLREVGALLSNSESNDVYTESSRLLRWNELDEANPDGADIDRDAVKGGRSSSFDVNDQSCTRCWPCRLAIWL